MSNLSFKYPEFGPSGKFFHVIARHSTRQPASPDRPRVMCQFFELTSTAFFLFYNSLCRRATLCPKCEMQEKDRDVYLNSTKRASLPMAQATTGLQQHHEKENSTATRRLRRVQGMDNGSLRNEYTRLETCLDTTFQVQGDRNTGNSSQYTKEIRVELSRDRVDDAGLLQHTNSNSRNGECKIYKLARNSGFKAPDHQNTHHLTSNSEKAGPCPLQDHEFKLDHNQSTSDSGRHNKDVSSKAQGPGNNNLPNACNPTSSSQDNRLWTHHGKKLRLRDLIMPIVELDWYTSVYATCMLYSPSSGISFAELLDHSQSESDEPRTCTPEVVRPEKKARKRLQKMRNLYHHLDSSNESFVCSRAREVENSEP
ncbi:hypothetical protein HDV63DRAFT_396601 [Trichoderma sp. SZMC 28014]